jgi:hypothetical protein
VSPPQKRREYVGFYVGNLAEVDTMAERFDDQLPDVDRPGAMLVAPFLYRVNPVDREWLQARGEPAGTATWRQPFRPTHSDCRYDHF